MRIVILGLSITSSWGNGHATTYRGLVQELNRREHDVLFLERDQAWYAAQRDLASPPYCRTELYQSTADLVTRFEGEVREADCVILGSYVPEGVAIGEWLLRTAGGVTAFYDIDTPVTLAKLARGDHEYLAPHLIPRFDLYLSFTGGPTLDEIERHYGSPRARALHCSVDPTAYFPAPEVVHWALGYLGTYSADRQPALDRMLVEPARQCADRRFIVAGPQYPDTLSWPTNVERVHHVSPAEHRGFFNGQSFTLNVTRADMIRAGYSPSVRLFEAAACGTPIISDTWEGLDTLFVPGKEILLAETSADVLEMLHDISEAERFAIGRAARRRILTEHTAAHRAAELEAYITGSSSSALHHPAGLPEGSSLLQPLSL